jgi:hypothetical protein
MSDFLYKDRNFLYEELVVKETPTMDVCKKANCRYQTLVKWCEKLNIPFKRRKDKNREKYSDAIRNLYINEKMSCFEIAKKLGVSIKLVSDIMVYNGIEKRSPSEANMAMRETGRHTQNRLYNVNEDYFKEWSSDMAYILGLIASDGTITKGKKNFGILKIGLKDDEYNVELLEEIRRKLSYTGNLEYGKSGKFSNVNLIIRSVKFCQTLIDLGIENRKSLIIEFPNVPKEYEMDFVRGYFDGDGSIGITYPTNKFGVKTITPQLRLRIVSGSEKILKKIVEVIHCQSDKEIPIKKVSKRKQNLYEIEYSTFHSIKIYEMMYKEDCLSLRRKRNIFEECISLRNI